MGNGKDDEHEENEKPDGLHGGEDERDGQRIEADEKWGNGEAEKRILIFLDAEG